MGRRLCRARTSTDQEESADAGHAGDRVVGGDAQSSNSEYSESWQQQHSMHHTVLKRLIILANTHAKQMASIAKPTIMAICTNWGKSPIVISCSIPTELLQ
jgi:hypothetical protein